MSFNEKLSYTEHVVTTPATDFGIGFKDYGGDSDIIKVTVDDVLATEAGYTVFRKNALTIALEPAVTSGVVRLQRETNIDSSFYRFTAGAKFVAANVDANFEQILHSQQETRDGFTKLASDVYPLVNGLEEALEKADAASQAAQEAAQAAEQAAANVTFKVNGVSSVSTLNTLAPVAGVYARVAGYYEGTLVGGGLFKYDPAKAAVNDGVLVFNGWVRVLEQGYITPDHAGALGANNDDTVYVKRAFECGVNWVHLPRKYKVTSTINAVNVDKITGVSPTVSGIWTDVGLTTILALEVAASEYATLLEPLSTAIESNTHTLTLSANSNLSNRDLIVVVDTTASSLNPARAYYYKGEIVDVEEVSANGLTVTLHTPFEFDYSVNANTKVYKLNLRAGKIIEDVSVTSTVYLSGSTCISLKGLRDTHVTNVVTSGLKYANITVTNCYNTHIKDSKVNLYLPAAQTAGLEYGIVITNSQNTFINGSDLAALRHAVAQGGSPVSAEYPVPIAVLNTHVTGCTAYGKLWALDAHGNAVKYVFDNNTIHNGVSISANRGRVTNNVIHGSSLVGISVATESVYHELVITGNTINTRNQRAITLSLGANLRYAQGTILITGNNITRTFSAGNTVQHTITYVSEIGANATNISSMDVVIQGNTVQHKGVYATSGGVFASTTFEDVTVTISDNVIRAGNGVLCQGFRIQTITDNTIIGVANASGTTATYGIFNRLGQPNTTDGFMKVTGNVIQDAPNYGMYLQTHYNVGSCADISNNKLANINRLGLTMVAPLYCFTNVTDHETVLVKAHDNIVPTTNNAIQITGQVDFRGDNVTTVSQTDGNIRFGVERCKYYVANWTGTGTASVRNVLSVGTSAGMKIPLMRTFTVLFTSATTLEHNKVAGITSNIRYPAQVDGQAVALAAGSIVQFLRISTNAWVATLLN